MNHTYQPSGKISILFCPAAAGMLVITAAAALLCVFGIQASHATLLDMMIYFAATKFVASSGTFLCVKGGRVRNPAFAKVCGIALAVWYWLLMLAFNTPVKAVLKAEGAVWIWKWDGAWKEALAQLSWLPAFWEPVLSLRAAGAVITGKSGDVLFTMPGIICVILLAVLFLAAVVQFGFAFWNQGRAPFCEVSGKWAKETVVNLRCREDETFLSRLLLGDTTVLADLEPLGGEDADCYFKVSVFAVDRSTAFYASVSRMIKADKEKNKRRKKPAFKEEQMAEYLVLDRGTGLSLLSRSRAEETKKNTCI